MSQRVPETLEVAKVVFYNCNLLIMGSLFHVIWVTFGWLWMHFWSIIVRFGRIEFDMIFLNFQGWSLAGPGREVTLHGPQEASNTKPHLTA